MNKFSPTTVAASPVRRKARAGGGGVGGSTRNSGVDDFDFGDLVAMTIVDVFETDANGLLLSYCPTFDNRAVHKTPEMKEFLRKGVGQMMETMEVVAKSPVGKSVNMVSERERE